MTDDIEKNCWDINSQDDTEESSAKHGGNWKYKNEKSDWILWSQALPVIHDNLFRVSTSILKSFTKYMDISLLPENLRSLGTRVT